MLERTRRTPASRPESERIKDVRRKRRAGGLHEPGSFQFAADGNVEQETEVAIEVPLPPVPVRIVLGGGWNKTS